MNGIRIKSALIPAAFIAAVLACSIAVAAKPQVITVYLGEDRHWELALVDGEVGFYGPAGAPAKGPLPDVPVAEPKIGLFRENNTLQVYVDEGRRKEFKVQKEKHLWVLTGDYSAKQPALKLTRGVEKYSRWELEFAGEKKGDEPETYYYIRNVNDLDKDAWLAVDEKGTRFKNGTEFRKATISFKEKQEFTVLGPDADGR